MGMVNIELVGSFRPREYRSFSAMKRGHAYAIAQVIEWLTKEVLPAAIANDHRCQKEGVYPEEGFGEPPVKKDA